MPSFLLIRKIIALQVDLLLPYWLTCELCHGRKASSKNLIRPKINRSFLVKSHLSFVILFLLSICLGVFVISAVKFKKGIYDRP